MLDHTSNQALKFLNLLRLDLVDTDLHETPIFIHESTASSQLCMVRERLCLFKRGP
jgi:hypothetical protein